MATLVRTDRNGTKYYEGLVPCDRCDGKGIYYIGVHNGELLPSWVDNGICFKCGGIGKVEGKWKEYTPEYEQKLAERRAKRNAKLRAEQEAELEKVRAEQERIRKAEEEARAIEEARIKAEKSISQYVGNIGEKITISGIYDHSAWFDIHVGWMTQTMYVHTFVDSNGNKLVWKTSSNSLSSLTEGDAVEIKGTVKEHSEYRDEKQTSLTRCKIQKGEL